MQRLLMSLFLLAMFAVAALLVAPLVVDPNIYKQELINTIKKSTGLNAEINGDIEISFLPYPEMNVYNISVQNVPHAAAANIIYVESIKVQSSFLQVLSGKVDITGIELVNPVLEIEQLDDGTKNWNILRQAFKEREVSSGYIIPNKISIKNGTISYRIQDKKKSVDYITADIEIDSVLGPYQLDGDFSTGDSTVKFSGDIGELVEGSDADFELRSDNFKVKMLGTYTGGDSPGIKGQVEGDTSNLKKFAQAFFDPEGSLSKIQSEEPMDFYGNFDVTTKTFSFKNVALASESLKGRADVDVLLGGTSAGLQWDVSVEVDKIDFDALFKEKKKESDEIDYYAYSMNKTDISDYAFNVPESLNALIKLYISNITYNEQNIENLQFDVDVFSGKAIINSFSAKLPGASKVSFAGNIDHNGTRPLLKGVLEASGASFRELLVWMRPDLSFIPEQGNMGEYLFDCDVKMTPQKIDISDIHLSFDQTLMVGDISARPAREEPIIKSNIKVDRFDFDRYGLTKAIAENAADFRKNISSHSLEASWLKLMSSKYDLYFEGKDITYNGQNVETATSTLMIARGLFSLRRLYIASSGTKMDGSLSIDLNSDQPIIKSKIIASAIDADLFLGKSDKLVVPSRQLPKGEIYWSREPFDFMGIDRFDGSFDFAIGSLTRGETKISDIIFKSSLSKKILNIEELSANVFGGRSIIKGSVGVLSTSPSIGISYVFSNLNFYPVVKFIDPAIETGGKFFLSGTARTFGSSPYNWIVNMITDAKLIGRGIRVNQFDLNEIIRRSRVIYSAIDMDVVTKSAMESGVTLFSDVEGQLKTEKGVLKASGIKLKTTNSVGVLAGNVSMLNGDLAATSHIAFRPEKNKKVTLVVNMTGNILNVDRELDTTNLESYITSKGGR